MWSPNSKEFGVVYGYMPAKATIFNTRAVATHSFALAPRNTIIFSPNGRFVIVAGFGNLAGQMDIYDLEKAFKKVVTIEAANTSVCEWSPDGKHILTATTSPRLRVDNGVRVWHVGGGLMYNEDLNELYDVCWRPQSSTAHPAEDPFHPMPTPHPSALAYLGTKKTPSKPAGAYRPPGARGQNTPLAFKREDEGGAAYVRDESSNFASSINGFGKPRKREVPGADTTEYLPPGAAQGGGVALPPGADGDEKLSKSAAKNKKKREAKKAKEIAEKESALKADGSAPVELNSGGSSNSGNPSPERRERKGHDRSRSKGNNNNNTKLDVNSNNPRSNRDRSRSAHRRQRSDANNNRGANGAPSGAANDRQNNSTATTAATSAAPDVTVTSPATPGGPQDKKIRGLLKKIRAIDELKMRVAGGEKLEDTQVKKIKTEDSVRKELQALGWDG